MGVEDNVADNVESGHRGPITNATLNFESDTLNYLDRSVQDDFIEYIYDKIIAAAKLKELTITIANDLMFLAHEFTDSELVVTNFKGMQEIKNQRSRFRKVAKDMKLGLRRIDANTTFFMILAAIETHHETKLTRSLNGFERVEQQTTRGSISSTTEDKTSRPPEPQGIRRMAINAGQGRD